MKRRKSEIIVVRGDAKGLRGHFQRTRIGVPLPWDELERAMGFCGHDVLVDITGVLEEIRRFEKALWEIKNVTDTMDGEALRN